MRGAVEDRRLVLLGHAAQHAQDLFRAGGLPRLQPAQGAVNLVFGVLADAARVEEDGVGLARIVDQFVARLQQPGGHQLAVQHVHLAADRFDVEAFGHRATQLKETQKVTEGEEEEQESPGKTLLGPVCFCMGGSTGKPVAPDFQLRACRGVGPPALGRLRPGPLDLPAPLLLFHLVAELLHHLVAAADHQPRQGHHGHVTGRQQNRHVPCIHADTSSVA